MQRMKAALTEAEVRAFLRDYLHDWNPGEYSAPRMPTETEQFAIAQARARLAELGYGPL